MKWLRSILKAAQQAAKKVEGAAEAAQAVASRLEPIEPLLDAMEQQNAAQAAAIFTGYPAVKERLATLSPQAQEAAGEVIPAVFGALDDLIPAHELDALLHRLTFTADEPDAPPAPTE